MHIIKRVTGSKGFESKTIMDDGAKRAVSILYSVETKLTGQPSQENTV
jgi:hypothetical protein